MANWQVRDNLVAKAGGGPGGPVVHGDIAIFRTVASDNDSAQLEKSFANAVVFLKNRGAHQMVLFPLATETGATIEGLPSVIVPANMTAWLTCSTIGQWRLDYIPISV